MSSLQICVVVGNGGSDPPGVDRMFYALEVFCENLEGELLPHLPALMERLFAVLAAPTSVHMKELSISAIGATGKYSFANQGEMEQSRRYRGNESKNQKPP